MEIRIFRSSIVLLESTTEGIMYSSKQNQRKYPKINVPNFGSGWNVRVNSYIR